MNLINKYHNPEPKKINISRPSNYLASYYRPDNIIVITRRDDWEKEGYITDDKNQEDIIDILNSLGLVSIGDSSYKMTGYIQDINTMLTELGRRGFELETLHSMNI